MVKAIADARSLAEGSDVGAYFRDLVQHARELNEAAIEVLDCEPGADFSRFGSFTGVGKFHL